MRPRRAPAAMGQQEALRASRSISPSAPARARSTPSSGATTRSGRSIDILMRRRQNNPILTGEAGVGKTAVVEGFALRIAAGDVPPALKDVRLLTLDVGLLQAGASMKGEFEQRLRSGDRRGAGLAEADHPLHRRGAYADRRRRRGGHGRCRQPAQAGARARHAAHHRRHDLGRVQEAHREGSGAHSALPGRAGRRAERGEGDPDDARRRLDLGEAPSRADARRGVSRPPCGCRTATSPRASCPTRPSACSTRPARACAISQHAMPPEVEDSRRRIAAIETELEIIDRERAIGIDTALRRKRRPEAAASGAGAPRDPRRALEDREATLSTGCSRSGPSCATAAAPLQKLPAPCRPTPVKLLAELRDDPDQARGLAGRNAAHPADRRSAGSGDGRAGLDRHTRRPHGQGRDPDGADARRHAEPARRRAGPRHGDDRQTHPDLASGLRQSDQADRRLPAVRPFRRRQDRDGA